MKKRGYFSFWVIYTLICVIIAIAAMYGIFHALIFPDGGFVDLLGSVSDTVGVLVVIIFIALSIGFGVSFYARAAINKANAVEYQEVVKVGSKTSNVGGPFFATGTTHFIAFEFPNRVRKTFEVDAVQCSVVFEGETGLLTYKQNKKDLYFVSFMPL